MKTQTQYIFKSERLGFRTWKEGDVRQLAAINADSKVMEYFPKPLSFDETHAFIKRLQNHNTENGYTYFAVEVLKRKELIGFIGLLHQCFESDFTPATDIGWRLKKSAWGKGYATEGAERCLAYAFRDLKLEKVIATCPLVNKKSEKVMKKIGMNKVSEFDHPKLFEYPDLKQCILYEIERVEWCWNNP